MQNEDLDETRSPIKDGRIIFYNVGDERGDASNQSEEKFFTFQGSSVEDLKEKLKEETGRDDIVVCCRNPFNAELHPLRLQLPPNNTDMHVVVITPSHNGQHFSYLFRLCTRTFAIAIFHKLGITSTYFTQNFRV